MVRICKRCLDEIGHRNVLIHDGTRLRCFICGRGREENTEAEKKLEKLKKEAKKKKKVKNAA